MLVATFLATLLATFLATLLAPSFAPPPAHAHHQAVVTRIATVPGLNNVPLAGPPEPSQKAGADNASNSAGSTPASAAGSTQASIKAGPNNQSRTQYHLQYSHDAFGKLMNVPRLVDAASPSNKILVRQLSATFATPIYGNTRAELVVPYLWISQSVPQSANQAASAPFLDNQNGGGLGDIALGLSHASATPGTASTNRFRWTVRGALIWPTGAYAPTNDLRIGGLRPLESGALVPSTFDASTSPGAGIHQILVGGELQRPVGRLWETHWALGASASWVQPLGRTPDGRRWGRDLNAGTSISALRFLGRFGLGLHAGGELIDHAADTGPVGEGPETRAANLGRRTVMNLKTGATIALFRELACGGAYARPLWRRVEGLQLVHS